MPLTVRGSLSNAAAFGDAIERFGRRSVAQQLRRGGERTVQIAEGLAAAELGKYDGQGKRRAGGGSYRGGFSAVYTGLQDFGSGNMSVALRNRSRLARLIEKGSVGHDIGPRSVGALSWPDMTDGKTALPQGRVVRHPGTKGHYIMKRAVSLGMLSGLGGRIAHANIRFTAR